MPRLIKRYGSRKLYDTAESRYVSLDEIAGFVREGQDVQVVENKTGDDVTAAVLTQIISEEGRNGRSLLSTPFLHDLVRIGERAVRAGEGAVGAGLSTARRGVDDLARLAVDRIRPGGPIAEVRDEMDRLRSRLAGLERTLNEIDDSQTD
ncbi:polyhydroxyalkanoate synthesis regulator DNA-binding domain-containing protein [Rubrivirga litoralis]|uniref:Polyhydroxyalkanoate synthesis regulator DNA-binding domain-containing protein n=1 Tax=Rubrivirga litoralis TaxID=3075598 RepID=A0ABU3BTA2_9BACT|nr:polyhydroxyalkanoate synthesis regulator DNA-binding domain-containing protein [Rubrivirga sp. F394]MDT0632465.1 polyhydroxyalkanoate synthesis regulator DNA-binding domain-containing protein [Rubrivirga sp. F394]